MIITINEIKQNYKRPIVIKVYSTTALDVLYTRLKGLSYYWRGSGNLYGLFVNTLKPPCQVCLRPNNEVSYAKDIDFNYANYYPIYRLVLGGPHEAKHSND